MKHRIKAQKFLSIGLMILSFVCVSPLALQPVAAQSRAVRVVNAGAGPGGAVSAPIELVAQGNENSVGFSLTFDQAVLGNPRAALGSGAAGASLNSNTNQAAQGRFGVALSLPTGQTFAAGTKQLVVVTFAVAAVAAPGATPIGFGDQPVAREVTGVNANVLTTDFISGTVTIANNSAPVSNVSAASFISGAVAAESIVAAFGVNLSTGVETGNTTPLPTTLRGTTVEIKDSAGATRRAPLFFVSPSQINYQMPLGTAAGAATVTVTSGDGLVSTGVTPVTTVAPGVFAANANGLGVAAGVALRVRPDNPAPAITSLSPTTAAVGGAAFTLTVNGTGFLPESVVLLNGGARMTTFVSVSRLTAAISTADIAAAGGAMMTVINPAPGGGTSNMINLPINNPSPSLSSLSHAMTTSGGLGFTLTVNGARFLPDSVVRWNGQNRATVFVSTTRLMAEITAADLVAPGAGQVTVFNPPPGGGASSSARIEIFDGNLDVRLTSGVASTGAFSPSPVNACGIRVFPQYTIEVPAGATRLQIELTSTIEVDLWARYGQRVDFPSSIVADYRSTTGFSSESITVTASSTPPLQSGRYYIAVGNCGTAGANFTLRATFSFNAINLPEPSIANAREAQPEDPVQVLAEALTGEISIEPEQITYCYRRVEAEVQVLLMLPLPPLPHGAIDGATPEASFGAASTQFPADTQTFEPLYRFDTAQNRFVSLPLDLGADRGVATDQLFLILFGTGIRARTALNAVAIRIGNLAAPVLYAGEAPGFVGLDQINVGPLPRSLAGRGEIDVALTVDGKTTNTVKVNIK